MILVVVKKSRTSSNGIGVRGDVVSDGASANSPRYISTSAVSAVSLRCRATKRAARGRHPGNQFGDLRAGDLAGFGVRGQGVGQVRDQAGVGVGGEVVGAQIELAGEGEHRHGDGRWSFSS